MKLRLSLAAAALFIAGTSSAQTAEEIIKKHNAAVGGDAWTKVTSMKLTGTMSMQGMDFPLTITRIANKGVRRDMDIMGTKSYVIMTTKEGWMYIPAQGMDKPQPMPEEGVKAAQSQLALTDGLMNYAANGSKVALDGTEKIGDVQDYKIKVTNKEGKVATYLIDPNTFYITRIFMHMSMQGQEQDVTTNFSDYKKLPEGVVIAMTTDNGSYTETIKEIELNKTKDESIFKPTN